MGRPAERGLEKRMGKSQSASLEIIQSGLKIIMRDNFFYDDMFLKRYTRQTGQMSDDLPGKSPSRFCAVGEPGRHRDEDEESFAPHRRRVSGGLGRRTDATAAVGGCAVPAIVL